MLLFNFVCILFFPFNINCHSLYLRAVIYQSAVQARRIEEERGNIVWIDAEA